ncbi:uncharacterized protein LOC123656620 [Melitaea cinxia]|uniref:uncharacterized protein LOC123656620 n=1 Tax=Melitaea cinxia TaxID=113334 RepID=UPI001E273F71|nr:uncharacterized protein LOC123656620 [Melitaea cinxia]
MLSDNLENECQEREYFENQYHELIAKARGLLGEQPSHRRELQDGSVASFEDVKAGGSKFNCVRLPKISIPTFHGHYQHWLEYRDTFISLIHSRSDIDDINKLHYLRASLKDSALLVIDSLDVKGDNYANAWKLLCSRYDNKRLLVNNHVQALFNVEQIQKESSQSIRHLIDITNKNLRALSTLDQPTQYWDTLIIHMMADKLDTTTRREWETHRNSLNNPPPLDIFMTFLSNRADLLETLQESKIIKSQKYDYNKSNTNFLADVKHNQNSNYNINKAQNVYEKVVNCPMCNQSHFLFNCETFKSLSIEDRIKKAKDVKVCLNCLRPGHMENRCNLVSCKYCKKRHNTLLHLHTTEPTKPIVSVNNFANSTNLKQLTTPPLVLLSTARVKVDDSKGVEHLARVLLDNGSTANFVTTSFCGKLGLSRRNESATVTGINNNISKSTQSCSLTIKSLYNDYSATIECHILPQITEALPSSFINIKDIPIPSELNLADSSFNKPATIDILVGADVFWSVLGKNSIDLGKHLPKLYETKLGWLVLVSFLGIRFGNNCALYVSGGTCL